MTVLSSVECRMGSCQEGAEAALLAWYRSHRRDLPWRHTRDPYRVWVSEIMLQQTQVATVLPRYQQWLTQFPTLPSLAAAGEEAVLKAWQGLGYYRRARLLYAAACRVMEQHDGQFPRSFEAIVALPGIGASTAGAIASACFDAPHPVVDANVKRVLRRWHNQPRATDRLLWRLAQQALERAGEPATWNQAMMELGACRCQARKTACHDCPLEPHCQSAHQPIAASTRRKPVRDLHWRIRIHHHPERGLWLTKRPDAAVWGGLWTPPIEPHAPATDEKPDLVHLLTHRRLHLYAKPSDAPPAGHGKWVAALESVALPTGIQRLLQQIGIS